MSVLLKLVPAWIWAIAVAGVAAVIFGAGWRMGGASGRASLAELQRDTEDQAELQRLANQSRAHDAEVKQAANVVYRERVVTKIIPEVRHATAPLAACPLPSSAVRMLNSAADCARKGQSPACTPDDGVPGARKPP